MKSENQDLPEAKEEATHVRQNAFSEISERLRTQDNRCTANPMFCVQERVTIYGMDPQWTDDEIWIDTSDGVMEVEAPADGEETETLQKTGKVNYWKTVMTAFTEKGCQQYLSRNGHNHRGETRIYVESFKSCPEMIAIREMLLWSEADSVSRTSPALDAGMKYFLDTEFIESGRDRPVTLISLGIVSEDGREYYAVSSEFKETDCSDWLKANVLPHLTGCARKPVALIASEVVAFVGSVKPEFWGYYADYDWVVFCQLFGSMINLPKGWPMYCRDIKQLCDSIGNPKLPEQGRVEHNALADARWNKAAFNFLESDPKGADSVSDGGSSSASGVSVRDLPQFPDFGQPEIAPAASLSAGVKEQEDQEWAVEQLGTLNKYQLRAGAKIVTTSTHYSMLRMIADSRNSSVAALRERITQLEKALEKKEADVNAVNLPPQNTQI